LKLFYWRCCFLLARVIAMGLDKYNQKRDFSKTAEPKAGRSKDANKLMFVIQKHDASRLHYDFRLEMDGVLKSWAVPKGPTLDPKVKRLAMMVEDHPFDYRNFEGIIPQGEYGGGTVIVWDQGWYETIDPIKGKKAQEKYLLSELKKGSVKMRLHGEKLNGEFALVRTHGMGENSWLLIKHDDDFSTKKDILKQDKSILSDKKIAEMEKSSDKVWHSNKEEKIEAKQPSKKKAQGKSKKQTEQVVEDSQISEESAKIDTAKVLKSAPKSAILKNVKPMLATLVDAPFDDSNWQYEVKWDGYRALAFINKGKVELLSRNNKSFDDKFYPIHKILSSWKMNAVFDGEILVLNDKGISNFGSLQNWRSEADGELVFYVFDILWYEGKNLTGLSLVERQAILNETLPTDDDRVRISKVFDANGTDFFAAAEKMGLEGIMAKLKSSTYVLSNRSKDWLKIKVSRRQEVIIAGFTRNEDTSKLFSSLILAVWENKTLTYVGKVGTGFSDSDQKKMIETFKPYITDKSPFTVVPDINKLSRFQHKQLNAKATWMKPELVCEVAYTEVTDEGIFRHPAFKGMRIDKNAKDVVRETAAHTQEVIHEVEEESDNELNVSVKTTTDKHATAIRPPKVTIPKTLLNPKDETQVRKVNGKELKFTHLSKVYWPEDGVTKRDMFNYYYQVADFMLPYLKDRPQSLNRFPGGIHGQSFYQKDVKGKAPDWAKTFPYSTSDGEPKEYLVGDDVATLLWMASLGCIEINPWFSRVQSPDNPDYCVIDLDPDKHHFDKVIEAALTVKEVLDSIDVPSYPKTSGSTGIHIYIPMGAKYTYDQTQLFARIIVGIVNEKLPDFTSLERMVSARKGKMYLDFLQNRPGATIAGPYSLRPKIGATVSMPLEWDEVKPGLKMKDFTIFNTIERLKKKGDIFKGVLSKGIDLEKAIKKAKEIYP
jgi:bifunctional non-homologous end joining protein LigD